MKRFLQTIIAICLFITAQADAVVYPFTTEPIDVVIPAHEKDLPTLELVIQGIRSNGANIRRIIVVSARKFTESAEWFDEAHFPFSKYDIAYEILMHNEREAKKFITSSNSRIGWIYQQFLKLYAPFVIPNISSNVLILDADTIFLRHVAFQDESGAPLFNVGEEYTPQYFEHAQKVIPGFKKKFSKYSGICHHMLFQRCVLEDLFKTISSTHNLEPWRVMCRSIERYYLNQSSMSEYEMYFNFLFSRSEQGKIRMLKWNNFGDLRRIQEYGPLGYDYVSCHSYRR